MIRPPLSDLGNFWRSLSSGQGNYAPSTRPQSVLGEGSAELDPRTSYLFGKGPAPIFWGPSELAPTTGSTEAGHPTAAPPSWMQPVDLASAATPEHSVERGDGSVGTVRTPAGAEGLNSQWLIDHGMPGLNWNQLERGDGGANSSAQPEFNDPGYAKMFADKGYGLYSGFVPGEVGNYRSTVYDNTGNSVGNYWDFHNNEDAFNVASAVALGLMGGAAGAVGGGGSGGTMEAGELAGGTTVGSGTTALAPVGAGPAWYQGALNGASQGAARGAVQAGMNGGDVLQGALRGGTTGAVSGGVGAGSGSNLLGNVAGAGFSAATAPSARPIPLPRYAPKAHGGFIRHSALRKVLKLSDSSPQGPLSQPQGENDARRLHEF